MAGKKSKPAKHKKTIEWEAFGQVVTGALIEDVLAYKEKLSIPERIDLLMKLLEYFKPKLSRSEIKAELETDVEKQIRIIIDSSEIDLSK